MKSNIISSFFIIIVLFGCGKTQPLKENLPALKTTSALESCEELKIPRDIAFNGHFIYHLSHCVSNKTPEGKESMPGTVALLDSIGIPGLDQITTLLLTNPKPIGLTGRAEYPFLRTFLTLTERGAIKDGVLSPDLYHERFELMQLLSEKLNPYWSLNLVLELNETGRLEKLLNTLGPLFLEGIDTQSLFAMVNQTLVDPQTKDTSISIVDKIFENDALYSPLKKLINIEPTYSFPNRIQKKCLSTWIDPLPKGAVDDCFEGEDLTLTGKMETSKDRFERFLDKLSNQDILDISNLVSDISNNFLTMKSKERLAALKKLSSGSKGVVNIQETPLRNLLGFLEFFAGEQNGIQNVKVSDLGDIMTGLQETIDATGPDAVKGLNHKMGSAKLHYLAEQLMLNGGTIEGCDLGFSLPALKKVDFSKPKVFFIALSNYFLPNDKCNGLSPLAVYYFGTIKKGIGLDGDCRGPDGNFYYDFCLNDENFINFQNQISRIDHYGTKRGEPNVDNPLGILEPNSDDPLGTLEPNPEVLKDLLITTLNEVKSNLERDPYYLHWLHFAEGKVGTKIIDFVIEKVSNLESFNLENLANLDNRLTKDIITRDVLREDFLENVLVKRIEDLKIFSSQFQDLFEETKRGNDNALRLFSGAYFKGPLEDGLISNLYTDKIDSSILESFKGDDFRVAELFGRMRLEGILINDHTLDPDDAVIDNRLLGDKARSVLFQFNQVNSTYVYSGTNFSKTPTQLIDVLGINYLRFKKILFDNPLTAVNVKTALGDEFDHWVENKLAPAITINSFWTPKFKEIKELQGLDQKSLGFFEMDPYSNDEIRKLSFFYAKNYLFADGSLPKEDIAYFPRVHSEQWPNILFTRLRLPNENGYWNGHLAYFPDAFLSKNELQTKKDIVEKINSIWEKDHYDLIDWNLLPLDKNNLNINNFSKNGLEMIKALSTLNLLTTNRKLKYMPVVGIGKECTLPNQERTSCPITFLETTSISGESLNAFSNYREYIIKSLLLNYCPFFKGKEYNYGFSESFYHLMYEGLKLNLDQKYLDEVCGDNKNLFTTLQDALPTWYHERILTDIISSGKNPKLKQGLEGLGIHLKYYKLREKFRDDPENLVRGLLNSNGYLPAEYLVYYVRETRDHKGFHAKFPGMLNIYLNYLFKVAMGEGSQIDKSLAYYGAGVLVNEELSKGIAQDFLENTVIKSQKDFPDKNANALELIFEILRKLTPEQLEAISSLVAYPQDIESLSNFTGTYSLFLRFLMGNSPGNFWQKPGSQALKQLMRQETVRAMVDILKDFNLSEVQRAFKVLQGSVVNNTRDSKQALKIISALKDFLKEEFLAGNDNQKNFEEIEASYKKIFLEIYQNFSVEEINYLMDQMVRKDLVSFDGKVAKPFYENNQALTYFAIKNIFSILDIYQGHFNHKIKIGKNDEHYFKKLVLSLVQPARNDANPGLKALSNFLKEPDLGSWNDLFAPLLFKQPFQGMLLKVLNSLSKVETKDVRLGLDETGILLPTTHNTLVYVKQRMEWNNTTALEIIDSVDVFKRLSEPNNEIWEKQNALLKNWLTQYEELK